MLIGVGVFTMMFAPFYLAELFYPTFLGTNGLSFVAFAICCICEGIAYIVMGVKLKHTDPRDMCIGIARYAFIMNPFVTLGVLSVSAIFPKAEMGWLYYLNIGLTAFQILIRILLIVYLNFLLKCRESGLLGIRNHTYIGMSILFVVLNYYVFAIIKSHTVDVHLLFEGDIAGLSEYFILISIAEVFIGIIILIQSLYLSLATYYSGKTDMVIDLRLNFAYTKKFIERHQIPMAISIFTSFILFMLALVSAFEYPSAYLALALLYFLVLAIRIPALFFHVRANRKHFAPSVLFFKEHRFVIIAAVLLIGYAVIASIFGSYALEKINQAEGTIFMTFGIFVPWSIIKMVLGIRSFVVGYKSGAPINMMNGLIDLLVALFTISHVLTVIAIRTEFDFVKILAIVLSAIIGLYCLFSAVTMVVVGILGAKGKRAKAFQRFLAFLGQDEDKQVKELSLVQEDTREEN